MLRFRAATPEQQVVVVAVGTAAIAVFVVLLFWAAFLR
jgi:flagellar biosynthesis/type III secretory pathway M-ring protein FliF/YscJ